MNSQALPKYSRPEIERRWRVPLEVALGLPVERVRIVDDLYLSLAGQPGRRSCKERRSMAQGALDVYRWPTLDFAAFEREYDTPQAALLDAAPPFAQAEIAGLADFSGDGLARERDA